MESAGRAKSGNSLVNEQDLFVTKTSNRRVTLRPLRVRICRKMGRVHGKCLQDSGSYSGDDVCDRSGGVCDGDSGRGLPAL